MRLDSLLLRLAAAAALVPASSAAQTAASGPAAEHPPLLGPSMLIPPSEWRKNWDGVCSAPVENPETRTTNVFLTLSEVEGPYPLLSSRTLTYIAQDIAQSLMRANREADGRLRLLPADSAFPPRIVLSQATLTLLADGSLTDIDLSGVVHDGFRSALRSALDSIVARGGVGGFDVAGSPARIPLVLRLATEIDATKGVAPLFTLEIPIWRAATVLPGNKPPPYPESARQARAEGLVLLSFIVEADGSVRQSSIRDTPPERLAPDLMQYYNEFLRAARNAVQRYGYRPAEYFGCRVPMWVQQPFAFSLGR